MINIDEKAGIVSIDVDGEIISLPFSSPEAFKVISDIWLKIGWNTKYVYSFSWLGRPVIQLPEDLIRIQEVIYNVRPTVIIETGVAHGGSLIFYAGLLKAMGSKGKVVGVDIEIRPHNRQAIETHDLCQFITLIEGSSIDSNIVDAVMKHIAPDDVVIVILDSCHSKNHVLQELELYGPLVSKGSFIVATDGIMGLVAGQERTESDWLWNNPEQAALAFVEKHDEFELVEPQFPFNESRINERVTYWPGCFVLRRDF